MILAPASWRATTGVWLLPGTPYRDDEAAYAAIGHCLETGTAFLGTCGGFQYAAVALARARLGLAGAGHRLRVISAHAADASPGRP